VNIRRRITDRVFRSPTSSRSTIMAPVAAEQNGSFSTAALKENLTLMATHDSQLELVRSKARQPGPGEALVHVRATGVCG
jgi:L-iditol 2-dehydrogenase